MWMISGAIIVLLGVITIGLTFVVQKVEDKNRVDGFYTTAYVSKVTEEKKGEKVKAVLEFSKDYKPMKVTETFTAEEALGLRVGRKVLIVYVPETGKVYHNPMRKYRNIQTIMIVVGFILLLTGVSIGMVRPPQ